jgi:hypothetical protein
MLNFLKGNSTREDVAICLEHILRGEDYVWDDYTSIVERDIELDTLRLKVLALESSHPPGPEDFYLNPEGREIIKGYIRELRNGGSGWMLA